MQVVRVRLLAFLPFCFVFVVVFLTIFVTCWLVSLYSYGWLFTAARGVAINVFLVYYRNFLRSWPNFERFGGFFLPEYFSRFVASPVSSPQIVGTSRKQGQGKIRHAWYGERESAPSLSSATRALFASVFISLNITLLEPGTAYLSCDKNGNFVAAPHCERYQRDFSPSSMSNTHHLFKSWSLRF